MMRLWGVYVVCALTLCGVLVVGSNANAQSNATTGAQEAAQAQEAAHKEAIAESIIAREEAASGRAFDPGFRAQVKNGLASLSLTALESQTQQSGLGLSILGDTQADLVYTPVTPCRIIDTRLAVGIIAAGATRNYFVTDVAGSFALQGGFAGSCGVPFGPATAVVINFVAVGPAGAGDLRYTPFGTPFTNTSIINYAPGIGLNIANAVVVPICNPAVAVCALDFTIQAEVAAVHLVADVLGWFQRPSKLGTINGLVWAAAHITGTGTPSVTRFFSNLTSSPTPTVTRLSTGVFEVNFNGTQDISARFFQVVPGNPATGVPLTGFCDVTPRLGVPTALFIQCWDPAGVAIDNRFFVQVY